MVVLGVTLDGTYHDYENSNSFSVECRGVNYTLTGTFGPYALDGTATSCELPCSMGFCIGTFGEVRSCWWGTVMQNSSQDLYKFISFVSSYSDPMELKNSLEIENLTNVFFKVS